MGIPWAGSVDAAAARNARRLEFDGSACLEFLKAQHREGDEGDAGGDEGDAGGDADEGDEGDAGGDEADAGGGDEADVRRCDRLFFEAELDLRKLPEFGGGRLPPLPPLPNTPMWLSGFRIHITELSH